MSKSASVIHAENALNRAWDALKKAETEGQEKDALKRIRKWENELERAEDKANETVN